MNKRITLAVFIGVASGCSEVGITPITGATGGATTTGSGMGSSGTGTSGGGSTSGIQVTVGQPCNPNAVIDPCAAGGLVCDATSGTCRLPHQGELCNADAGCGGGPPNLGCYPTAPAGIPESVCLVRCTSTDSSDCPYGYSCGDPNLLGFCSLNGTPDCTLWSTCSLGGGVSGSCVPNGTHSTCFASGTLDEPYAMCNPVAINSDAAELCAAGSVCGDIAPSLGVPASGGVCLVVCGDGGTACPQTLLTQTHCSQPMGNAYGTCRPGLGCGYPTTCGAGSVCVPDDPSSLSGGCLFPALDAGVLYGPCTPSDLASGASACLGGVCVPADGGFVCAIVCDLADGGTSCPPTHPTCTPLDPSAQSDVVGACR